MDETIVIDRRYCGPPESGNGGYVCGVVGGLIGGSAEVTLRLPPPLDRPLTIVRANESVELRDRESVVATGVPSDVGLDVPDAVSFADAEDASTRYPAFENHVFPTCFTCGPERAQGDGLRIFAGAVADRPLVAAPWAPDASVCEGGVARAEIVWAALDCPSGFAALDFSKEKAVLGRFAARLFAPVREGERYVVTGWPLGDERRKRFAGSALFDEDGSLVACARSTWVMLE
ncbi:MAG: hypothetical protein WEE64_15015 [Dehalococcoidia bacterium]